MGLWQVTRQRSGEAEVLGGRGRGDLAGERDLFGDPAAAAPCGHPTRCLVRELGVSEVGNLDRTRGRSGRLDPVKGLDPVDPLCITTGPRKPAQRVRDRGQLIDHWCVLCCHGSIQTPTTDSRPDIDRPFINPSKNARPTRGNAPEYEVPPYRWNR